MKLLLTNDDGIDAAGLAALRAAAETIGRPLAVAPERCHSGGGHQVTTHQPIRLTRRDERSFVTDGTPADCVRVALHQLAADADWVLAGINHGGNLGADLYMSGTAAAVREGVLHGKPGIAVSHYHRKGIDPLDWPRATRWLAPILRDLVSRPWQPGTFWNVNLPHVTAGSPDPDVVICPIDPSPLPVSYETLDDGVAELARVRETDDDLNSGEFSYRHLLTYNGNYHQRLRQSGSDVDVCFSGRISISLVKVFPP